MRLEKEKYNQNKMYHIERKIEIICANLFVVGLREITLPTLFILMAYIWVLTISSLHL